MVAQCCTTGEVIHFIMDVLSDGDGSDKEDILQGEGNFKVDPDSEMSRLTQTVSRVTVVMTPTVTIQKKMLRRWTDPVPSWVGGVVVVEKCNVVVVVVVLGGKDTMHMVPMENWYVAAGRLCFWCFWLWDSSPWYNPHNSWLTRHQKTISFLNACVVLFQALYS